MKPLRVTVTLAVEIENPDDWTLAFGTEGRDAIREDVREYVLHNAHDGVFSNGEVAATIERRS